LADRGLYEAKTYGKNRAIGILPSELTTKLLVAAAGGHASAYSVQTQCVAGPPQFSNRSDCRRTMAEIQLVSAGVAECWLHWLSSPYLPRCIDMLLGRRPVKEQLPIA